MRQEVSKTPSRADETFVGDKPLHPSATTDFPFLVSRLPPLVPANSYLFGMLLFKPLDTLIRLLFRQRSSSCGRRCCLTCCLLTLSTLLPSLRKNFLLEVILNRS